MHIFSNTICDDFGRVVGTFSSHTAAFAALMRIGNPGWQSLSGPPSVADAAEEKRIANVNNGATMQPLTTRSLI